MCLLTLLAFVVEEQAVMRQGQGELHFRCFHFLISIHLSTHESAIYFVLNFLSEPLIVMFKLNI